MIATFENIRKIRPISENVNDEKRLQPYINEVENLIIIPALGADLYKKILSDKTAYSLLLSGGYYDEEKKHLTGLYEAIGYLVYSRFVRNQNYNLTAFGVVQKQSQFSEPLDEKAIIRISNDAEKVGKEYLGQCLEYLKFSNKTCKYTHNSKSRIKAIGD